MNESNNGALREAAAAGGLSSLPGFVDSLRLLVDRERYSFSDIGAMFGVSRERVRQLCHRYGIVHPDGRSERGMAMYRAWDEKGNRFIPVGRWLYNQRRYQKQVATRREVRRLQRREAQRKIIAVVADLRARLGRDPLWWEIWKGLTGKMPPCKQGAPMVLAKFFGGKHACTKQNIAEFRLLTGLGELPRGGAAHSDRIDRRTPATTRVHHERIDLWKPDAA